MGGTALQASEDGSVEYRRAYAAYHARVLAYCARRVGRDDASDLAAEVFAIAWRRREDAPAEDRLLPWLYGIAFRAVSHHWRGQGRRRKLANRLASLSPDQGPGVDVQVVQREEFDRVLMAVGRLKLKDREVLRLSVWEELRHHEIAEVLGCTEQAARQRFHRAKKALLEEYLRLGGVVPIPAVAPEGGEQ